MKISIIIPVLNEEKALPETLQNIAECAPGCEVLIVDGGSADSTRAIVKDFTGFPIVLLESPKGRGTQMNVGAKQAEGDILLFLHADTHLPPDTPALIERALRDTATLGGFFQIAFVPHSPLADFYARCYNVRSHFRIFYGDACLFVRREVFERLGGYQAALLMEDFELVLRLRRAGRLAYIREGAVRSSSRRFSTTSVGVKMLFVWFWLHILMACGVSQEKLARFYPEKR